MWLKFKPLNPPTKLWGIFIDDWCCNNGHLRFCGAFGQGSH